MQTTNDAITLMCLVFGETSDRAFPVDIDKTATVGHLKIRIKLAKQPEFNQFAADKLTLWSVSIPVDNNTAFENSRSWMAKQKRLHPAQQIVDIFPQPPAKMHVHIIAEQPKPPESPPVPVPHLATSIRQQELLEQLAILRERFLKSEHDFDLIVKPNRKTSFKWLANLETVTLVELESAIFAKYPAQEQLGTAFDFETEDGEIFSPRSDASLQGTLRQLIAKNKKKLIVSLETPSKAFSDWELKDVCRLYGISDDSLEAFPTFECGSAPVNKEALSHLMTELEMRLGTTPITYSTETTKSVYVFSFLNAAVSLYKSDFTIRPEKWIEGRNGRGPVDYAIDSRAGKTVGITEVKERDFKKGVAQNSVQLESAILASRKRKAGEMEEVSTETRCFGIVSDAEKWYFLECKLDEQEKPKFKLSTPRTVVFGESDMQSRVGAVFGHITWLLDEVLKSTPAAAQNKKAKVDDE